MVYDIDTFKKRFEKSGIVLFFKASFPYSSHVCGLLSGNERWSRSESAWYIFSGDRCIACMLLAIRNRFSSITFAILRVSRSHYPGNPSVFDSKLLTENKRGPSCTLTRSSADADNRLDAFSDQSRSTNMVPFHMLHIVSYCAIVTLSLRRARVDILQKNSWPWNGVKGHSRSLRVVSFDRLCIVSY